MQPSWSPDGTALALLESDGIHVFENIPDLRAATPDCGRITDRLLVRGSAPGWGPADVPAGGSPPPAAPATPPAAHAGLAVTARQSGRAVRVRLQVGAAGSTVRVRLTGTRRRIVGAAVRRHAQAGTLTLRVPLNRRGRAALSHARRLKLSVSVSVTPPGGSPATAVRAVTLRR
jgi:hypothetical protein